MDVAKARLGADSGWGSAALKAGACARWWQQNGCRGGKRRLSVEPRLGPQQTERGHTPPSPRDGGQQQLAGAPDKNLAGLPHADVMPGPCSAHEPERGIRAGIHRQVLKGGTTPGPRTLKGDLACLQDHIPPTPQALPLS